MFLFRQYFEYNYRSKYQILKTGGQRTTGVEVIPDIKVITDLISDRNIYIENNKMRDN